MVQASTRTNPFPGLRPFDLDEEHLFFGREGQADELLVRLGRTHFLGVVGTSGSGKSSLVRAGLLPSLYSGFLADASSGWRVAILRPGNAPIGNLAMALNDPEVFGVEPTSDDAVIRTALTESTLRRGALGLVEVTQQARMESHENLLVVVDQFEEIFRFKQQAKSIEAEDEAAAFVKMLLAAAKQWEVPIFVVLTMRSDFLGDCAQFRDLPEALNESQYLIPRLTRGQLRRAIEGPVAVGGATITPQLVNRLLNDVGDNPDQLPILQHALMRTWDYWEEQGTPQAPIDMEHYEAIGGMATALSRHADQIYEGLLDDRSRYIAKILFKRLTDRSANYQGIRRPTPLGEISALAETSLEEIIAVVDEFRAPHRAFLMPPLEVTLTEEKIIDISHESLIRGWVRLRNWIEEEEHSSNLYYRLSETARLYQTGKAELLRDPELTFIWDWRDQNKCNEAWAERYNTAFQEAMEFLEESIAARYAGGQRREKAEIDRQIKSLGKFDIFLAFHPKDKVFVKRLYDALTQQDYSIWVDWEDILPGSDWQKAIDTAIESSNNIVFIVSPDSLKSHQTLGCLEQAIRYNKRIIPICWREPDTRERNIHPIIRQTQWISFEHDTFDFDDSFQTLIEAINYDLAWTQLHTRLLTQALEWERNERDKSFLLRGSALKDSEQWLLEGVNKEPAPTELQSDYIAASQAYQQKETKRLEALTYKKPSLSLAVMTSFLVTAVVTIGSFAGVFQPMELWAYDSMTRLQPRKDEKDDKILIVKVTEEDIVAQLEEGDLGIGSLSDTRLNRLLQILESNYPRVIGLNIYRDFSSKIPELEQRMATNKRLITTCKVPGTDTQGKLTSEGVASPPGSPPDQIGFNDVLVDRDGVVRRQLLFLEEIQDSPCVTKFAFSLKLAQYYLGLDKENDIALDDVIFSESDLFIGEAIIPRLAPDTGPYQLQTLGGYQIMINYLKGPNGNIRDIFQQVSLNSVLKGEVPESQIRDKLVLIGIAAESSRVFDSFVTPYDKELPGLILQAQMTGQLIDYVLEGRPLIEFLPFWIEVLWIGVWSLIGGLFISNFRLSPRLRVAGIASLAMLCGLCCWIVLVIYNVWSPIVLSIFALVTTGSSLLLLSTYSQKEHRILAASVPLLSCFMIVLLWRSSPKSKFENPKKTIFGIPVNQSAIGAASSGRTRGGAGR
ncbi:MAG: CHASE2 domain-containing protein [Cyanobacteria bacterium P01_C01_bin.118]